MIDIIAVAAKSTQPTCDRLLHMLSFARKAACIVINIASSRDYWKLLRTYCCT